MKTKRTPKLADRAFHRCRTMTIEQAAVQLGIGRSLAYEAARRGEIPTIRIGRKLLVPIEQLERLLGQGGQE